MRDNRFAIGRSWRYYVKCCKDGVEYVMSFATARERADYVADTASMAIGGIWEGWNETDYYGN